MVVVRRCLSLLYVVHVMVGNLVMYTADYNFEHYTAVAAAADFDIEQYVVADNIAVGIVEEEDPIYSSVVVNCQVMNCN